MIKRSYYKKLLTTDSGQISDVCPYIDEFYLLKIQGKEFNNDFGNAGMVLKEVYNKILKSDPLWHFIYEGSFTILRVSTKSAKSVKGLLSKLSVEFEYRGKWGVDEQRGTREYQKVFTYLFHGFSVLAMEVPSFDLLEVTDRVVHIHCNSLIYKLSFYRQQFGSYWESIYLAENAIMRGVYTGQRAGWTKAVEYVRNLEVESKDLVELEKKKGDSKID